MVHQPTQNTEHLSILKNFRLSFYWFTANVQWTALIIIVVPRAILYIVGRNASTSVLSVLVVIGSIIATVVQPWAGWVSDRVRHHWGRRRPYILLGTLGNIAGLLVMGYSGRSLILFALGYFMVQFFANLAQAAYQALIPDIVSQSQRGTASGWMGFMTQFAIIFGALAPNYFAGTSVFWVLSGLLAIGWAVTQFGIKEQDSSAMTIHPVSIGQGLWEMWISPKEYPDFWWVFATRLMVMLGFATLENYLFYYLKFTVGLKNPEGTVLDVLVLLTVGSLISVLVAGWLSDRLHRRKILVTTGGLFMGSTALAFVFSHNMDLIFVMAVVFGMGYGTYLSTDWALAVDVLPPGPTEGRSMGLWQASLNLGQVGAGLIAGALIPPLSHLVSLGTAYRYLFLVTFIYFVLGSVLVYKVKHTSPDNSGT
jgi:MFS family permease